MSTGLEWNETNLAYGNPANNYRQMLLDPDPYRLVLAKPLVGEPGLVWDYNSGATALLGAILRKVSGRPIDALAREALLEPLGIADWEWARGANGDPRAASGLRLTIRDLAKIGQLVLERGKWGGRQVVSAGWIESSSAPIMRGEGNYLFNNGRFAYGYHWWIGRSSAGGRDIEWIVGSGFGGQRLYIVPSEKLVIASYEGSYGKPLQGLAGSTALTQVLSARSKTGSNGNDAEHSDGKAPER
jgi:CubicO group peptidase (beta-lactamase class C family)